MSAQVKILEEQSDEGSHAGTIDQMKTDMKNQVSKEVFQTLKTFASKDFKSVDPLLNQNKSQANYRDIYDDNLYVTANSDTRKMVSTAQNFAQVPPPP